MTVKTPHKHAELIKAWAEGAEIQYRIGSNIHWVSIGRPGWDEDVDYRIKPTAPKEPNYGRIAQEAWYATAKLFPQESPFSEWEAVGKAILKAKEEHERALKVFSE